MDGLNYFELEIKFRGSSNAVKGNPINFYRLFL